MQDEISAIKTALDINLIGLKELRNSLSQPALASAIQQAVDTILSMKGRLIISGLGKSGHIGSKLAATFSSTGTPAYFVHPAEASHGDLGMIQSDDVVMMLSWSGETRELSDLATYAQRFDVPLIILTGNGDSGLAKAANIALVLPQVQESCPHNLAPTTSTLLQLAMGDAIAVTLLSRKGFSETSFHNFHPGGKLGASLTQVRNLMVPFDQLPLVTLEAPVIDVVGALSDKNLGIVGILDEAGGLAGVVTDGDIRRYLASQSSTSMQVAMRETFARNILTTNPTFLAPNRLAARALNIMQSRKISAAFVVQDGQPIGLITVLQLLNAGTA